MSEQPDTGAPVLDAFFARQPIFDRKGRTLAYELLYRASPDALAAGGDPAFMSAKVASEAMLSMNLDTVTDGLPAYVNTTGELLVAGVFEAVDPSRIVIEILESVEPGQDVIRACARLVSRGHTLALDDWFEDDPREPLLPYASIVKIDVLERPERAVDALASPLRTRKLRLVAERVEDATVHDACVQAGFDLFQGYYYRRPEIVRQPDIRPDQLAVVQAMNLVRDDAVPASRVGGFFKHDPSLAYKLVRMANMAPMGVRNIDSVEHAVAIVGRAAIFRWLALLLAASFKSASGIKRELLREALIRARLCELLAEAAGSRQGGHLFLVGLFSRIEALLGIPLATVLTRVSFPEAVDDALRNRSGPYAPTLALAEAYEDLRWDDLEQLSVNAGVAPGRVPAVHRNAFDWAMEVSRSL